MSRQRNWEWEGISAWAAVVVLSTTLLVTISSCKRRDDVAEPIFSPSQRILGQIDEEIAAENPVKPAGKKQQSKSVNTKSSDKKVTGEPKSIVASTTVSEKPVKSKQIQSPKTKSVEPLSEQALDAERTMAVIKPALGLIAATGSQPRYPVVWLGKVGLSSFDGAVQGPLQDIVNSKSVNTIFPITDSGLWLIERNTEDKFVAKIRTTPMKLGEFVWIVTLQSGRSLAVTSRVSSLALHKRNSRLIQGTMRFLVLDRAYSELLVGAAVVDGKGALVGVITSYNMQGMSTVIDSTELRVLAAKGSAARNLYFLPEKRETLSEDSVASPAMPRASETVWLGLHTQAINAELAESFGLGEKISGALVTQVLPESPAQKAGLAAGDVIVAINESMIHKLSDLPGAMAQATAGQPLSLRVIRESKETTLSVVPALRTSGK